MNVHMYINPCMCVHVCVSACMYVYMCISNKHIYILMYQLSIN